MRMASIASFSLRSRFCSFDSRKFLATCWVMVEAPSGRFLPKFCRLLRTARTMPVKSSAAMLVEALVLGREEGRDHQLRHDVDRHEDAPLAGVLAIRLPSWAWMRVMTGGS